MKSSNITRGDLVWIVPSAMAGIFLGIFPEYQVWLVWVVLLFILGGVVFFLAEHYRDNRNSIANSDLVSASKSGSYGIEDLFASSMLSPDYRKIPDRLRSFRHPDVVLEGSALFFSHYPFEPAIVFPSGRIEVDHIAEINLSGPIQVRLKCGDILFVPYSGKEALMRFINQNDLQVVNRSSVWSALLDPFLDTSESQEAIDRQFAWFASIGLDRATVDQWRREVGPAMIAYNFGTYLWEWVSLDFYDVLVAQHTRLNQAGFTDFYSRAMALAAIDPGWNCQYVPPELPPTNEERLERSLFSVLLDWYPDEKDGDRKDFSKHREERSAKIKCLKQQLFEELSLAYSEPHRHYHTLAHIEIGLFLLERDWDYAIRLNEVRWALIFHDAIYDPQRQDNEFRSADWACRVMAELGRSEEEKARVRAMILATAHTGEPQTPDEALLLDIDLSILGAKEETFAEYERLIHAEYQWMTENAYRRARVEVLGAFTKRQRIYHTALYRQRCEQTVRLNIDSALDRLRSVATD
ncbi:MAG: putative metal-dependent phosphohydrolase [Proteobacteria bacterium]|nr:putative metal-dependent phosphohydrolase [Pseudomonadota bacterium]